MKCKRLLSWSWPDVSGLSTVSLDLEKTRDLTPCRTWATFFFVYDLVKDRFRDRAEHSAHPQADMALVHMCAATVAGATGTILTNPLWVVKTRFMAQAILPPSAPRYHNTLDAITTIWRTEGPKSFYRGLLPSLIGVSHVSLQFALYERAKAWAGESSLERRRESIWLTK